MSVLLRKSSDVMRFNFTKAFLGALPTEVFSAESDQSQLCKTHEANTKTSMLKAVRFFSCSIEGNMFLFLLKKKKKTIVFQLIFFFFTV